MASGKQRVALFFGGRSTEHEVSVVTALQALKHFDPARYDVIPIYISKSGDFYTGSRLADLKNYQDLQALTLASTPITLGTREGVGGYWQHGWRSQFTPFDVAFPLIHGSFGEDGCLQGLLESYRIPYSGFGVVGSAIGMDKYASKLVFQALGLPIGKYVLLRRADWQQDQDACLRSVEEGLRYPLFVKPGTIGSSIGVARVDAPSQLAFAIDVAAVYSDKVLVEEAFTDVIEVNCAALGYREPQASPCERPLPSSAVLSYEDKYQRGESKGAAQGGMASASRLIPAPISGALTERIQETTVQIFEALDGCGVARVDYFVDPQAERFWVNEINTIPGSLSFYLWEKDGLSYSELLDRLVACALERAAEQRETQYTFASDILSHIARSGIKG